MLGPKRPAPGSETAHLSGRLSVDTRRQGRGWRPVLGCLRHGPEGARRPCGSVSFSSPSGTPRRWQIVQFSPSRTSSVVKPPTRRSRSAASSLPIRVVFPTTGGTGRQKNARHARSFVDLPTAINQPEGRILGACVTTIARRSLTAKANWSRSLSPLRFSSSTCRASKPRCRRVSASNGRTSSSISRRIAAISRPAASAVSSRVVNKAY